MKLLLTLLFTAFFCVSAFATAQYPDKIFFKGQEYDMHTNPLESYFAQHPEKRPKGGAQSTALWRGYVATFEIKDSLLFVKDITIQIWDTTANGNQTIKWKSVLNEVFPDQKEVKVDWLTGLLVLPYGKLINYVHMGYGSTYENYLLLEINNGTFVKGKEFDSKGYEKFKEKQFRAFKSTDDYKKTKEDLKKKGYSDDMVDDFLRSFVTEYTSKILVD